jgi:hypothetical protein
MVMMMKKMMIVILEYLDKSMLNWDLAKMRHFAQSSEATSYYCIIKAARNSQLKFCDSVATAIKYFISSYVATRVLEYEYSSTRVVATLEYSSSCYYYYYY